MTEKTAEQDRESKSVASKEETVAATDDNRLPGSEATSVAEISAADTGTDSLQDQPADTHTTAEESIAAPPEPAEKNAETEADEAIVPGSLSRALKKCRENADLSMEQAAGEMRLPLSVIRALEDENFADLPEPPYVRGYLRSYARLSESDPNPLINRYETLRGADPRDRASYTAPVPRHQSKKPAKKEMSPTTVKLAGFSMIVLLLVVLSMIPAVSQWATDTWKAFSEPQDQQLAAKTDNKETTADTGDTLAAEAETKTTPVPAIPSAVTNNDTVADNTEQLALNNQDSESAEEAETAEAETAEEAATNAGTDTTPAPDDKTSAADTATGQSDTTEDATTAQQADKPADESQTAAQNTDSTPADQTATDTQDTDSTPADQTATDTQDGTADSSRADATDQTSAATDDAGQTAQEAAAPTPAEQEQTPAAEAATQQAQQEPQPEQKQADNFQQPFDGNVTIRLVFSQPVWMSIKDGRGKTIFGALNSAGTVKELQARTPLEFHVGNAPGVQIFLNGQLIDQRPHTRGSVARFRAN